MTNDTLAGLVASLLLLHLLPGCTTSRYQHQQDFTPAPIADIKAIKEPTPVSEPRSSLGNPARYRVLGKDYDVMEDAEGFTQEGIASWYGMKFHGHDTSNGETFDVYKMTAAHKTLPLPSYVRVTRQDTGKSVIVRVNDRGPFHEGRIIDLSYAAAVKLDIHKAGTAPVRIEVLKAPLKESIHWIQAGALGSREAADNLYQRLKNISADVGQGDWDVGIYPKVRGDITLHRVRIGPIPETQIAPMIEALRKDGIINPVLLSQHQLER